MLEKSVFYRLAERKDMFVIDGQIYLLHPKDISLGNESSTINATPFSLALAERMYFTDLEASKPRVSNIKNNEEHMVLARFVVERLAGEDAKAEVENRGTIVEKIIPNSLLIAKGKAYELKQGKEGKVEVCGNRYYAVRQISLDNLEKAYQTEIQMRLNQTNSWLERLVQQKCYYYPERNIGFEIQDSDFYVFTKVRPYALYERNNGKTYKFAEAKVGSRMSFFKYIGWNNLVVLNKYSHPALRMFDQELQEVCVGDFSYSRISEIGTIEDQVWALMRKGRKVMGEYYNSSIAWHSLEEDYFQKQITNNPNERVLNLD